MNQLTTKVWFIPLLAIILCGSIMGGWFMYQSWLNPQESDNSNKSTQHQTNISPTPNTTITPTPTSPLTTPTPSPTSQQLKLFMVAVEDDSQPTFGCGDSLQPVTRTVTTSAPLTAALTELLSIKDQHYGQSGLYNALYRSNLTVQSVTINQGIATIKLTGQLSLGGSCDGPRVEQQLTTTAKQFDSVSSVVITINDQPLAEALSGR